MYRDPDRTPECTFCGRTNLSPSTRLDPTKGFLAAHFKRVPTPESGPVSGQHSVVVQRARICLDCGHVMLFIDGKTLAELKAALPALAPIGVD